MYRWHLRKAVLFLLDYVENSDYSVIPAEIVDALSIWDTVFGGTADESRKIDVLKFISKKH